MKETKKKNDAEKTALIDDLVGDVKLDRINGRDAENGGEQPKKRTSLSVAVNGSQFVAYARHGRLPEAVDSIVRKASFFEEVGELSASQPRGTNLGKN